jgi:D-amino peptidase
MKILIACDMEGISGVVNWDQVDPDHTEFVKYCHLLTEDVNAVVHGALKAGMDDILVTDGHDRKNNILIEELDPSALLITGGPTPLAMIQGISDGIDCAVFLAYHAKAGTYNAILPHTGPECITNVWMNGQVIGELGMNAAVCGHFGVPVILATGDQALCAEAHEIISGIETVTTKIALGFSAAMCFPREVLHLKIKNSTTDAIKKLLEEHIPHPLKLNYPISMQIEFCEPSKADQVSYLPNINRINGCTIEYQSPDSVDAYRMFRAIIGLMR